MKGDEEGKAEGEGKGEKENEGEEKKEGEGKEGEAKVEEGKGEGKEEGKDNEPQFLPGPIIKKIKVEVIPPTPEELTPTPIRRERTKRKRPDSGPVGTDGLPITPGTPGTAPVEEVARAPKKRGRPKKERPTLTLTQEMIPLINKAHSREVVGGGMEAPVLPIMQHGDVQGDGQEDVQGDVLMNEAIQAAAAEIGGEGVVQQAIGTSEMSESTPGAPDAPSVTS